MEDWTNFGPFQEPTDWATPNQFGALLSIYSVFKDSITPHTGLYAAELETVVIPFLGTFPGIVSNGELDQINYSIKGGVPMSDRPEKFLGWYKYFPVDDTTGRMDTCSMEAYLTRWDDIAGVRDTVGYAIYQDTAATDSNMYTPFEVDFVYNSGNAPDTLLVMAFSSRTAFIIGGNPGSRLFVDDLGLSFGPLNAAFNLDGTCMELPSQFSNATLTDDTTNANAFFWDFGDGNTSTLEDPIHTYDTAGTYMIQLIVADTSMGDTLVIDTHMQSIVIYGYPEVDAGPNKDFCVPYSVMIQGSGDGPTYSWSPTTGLTDPNIPNPIVSLDSIDGFKYYLTVTNQGGCSSTDSVWVYVKPNATVEILMADTVEICSDSTLMIEAMSSEDNYEWTPTLFLSDSVSAMTSFTPVDTSGLFTLFLYTRTDQNCRNQDTLVVRVIDCDTTVNSIEDELLKANLSVYPNPTDAQIALDFDLPEITDMRIRLFDLRGILLYERTYLGVIGHRNISVDMESLPQGIYQLRLETQRGQVVKKIIKQ